ncbi:DNA repair protein RecN [Synechococcus sp. PCC 7502]|uniref:DNA repair protein RecN n=1 Tax=Synechococcus sp. PCC 7502 TaxID=1173263 RepID=UPI00029F9995|nr:DNA repair protein RecN [Synechococcus sp. PCC 7502]AFY74562.1 DNA repair protein RecN [Synechococcus sp. PCC 7502]
MLLSLKIQNFALIDYLELELHPGLNILTGETGAGKSIILDALDAALGGKITAKFMRTGTERAAIEAVFKPNSVVTEWLASQEIDLIEENQIICSREITAKSNRTRINGVVVNKQQIQELREKLVEITAQGQTVLLGRASMQREWLDSFGGVELISQRQIITKLFENYQKAKNAVIERQESDRHRLQQLDMLQYQLQELEAADLEDPEELNHLESERLRLSHSVDLQQQSYQVYEALYAGETRGDCAELLADAEAVLIDMVAVDPNLEGILELVSSALAQVQEASRQINNYGANIDSDPDRLERIEDRIRQLKQICRKYGSNSPTGLREAIAHKHKLEKQLAEINANNQPLEVLEKIASESLSKLTKACAKLTKLRHTAAKELEQQLINALKSLAMEKVQFQVKITEQVPNSSGADQVSFEFSPNLGEPLQPLAETASGGEISRFLLALKTCFAKSTQGLTPLLVFDEIDVGVSGRVSQAIAQRLFQLGQGHQVLCVTHQPIVAAIADHHFQVSKKFVEVNSNSSKSERTIVEVELLNPSQRKQELANLAGGVMSEKNTKEKDKTTDSAIIFAESLLTQAQNLKQELEQLNN